MLYAVRIPIVGAMTFVRRRLKLHEVSLVKHPANPGARVALFKAAVPGVPLEDGDLKIDKMTLPEDVRKYVELQEAAAAEALKAAEAATKQLEDALKAAEAANNPGVQEEVNKADLPSPVRAALEKAEADAAKSKADAEALAARVAKMEDESLTKSIAAELDGLPSVIPADKRAGILATLKGMDETARAAMIDTLTQAEKLAKAAAELVFKTTGRDSDPEGGSVSAEVNKQATEMMKTQTGLTHMQARAAVVKQLSPDERAKYNDERRS